MAAAAWNLPEEACGEGSPTAEEAVRRPRGGGQSGNKCLEEMLEANYVLG